jgi:hypothetical protein
MIVGVAVCGLLAVLVVAGWALVLLALVVDY